MTVNIIIDSISPIHGAGYVDVQFHHEDQVTGEKDGYQFERVAVATDATEDEILTDIRAVIGETETFETGE